MVENEQQYRVTRQQERKFAQLVKRMESGEAESVPDEDPVIRQAKMDAARSVLDELREEFRRYALLG